MVGRYEKEMWWWKAPFGGLWFARFVTFPSFFSDLPPLGSIMIKIFKENYNKKKKEKVPSAEVGRVEIPALILESGNIHEKW